MKRNSSFAILILFLFSVIFIPALYAEQNTEEYSIEYYIDLIDENHNIYCNNDSEKDIDSKIEKLKREKVNLESEEARLVAESNNIKFKIEQNNASYTEIIENNKKLQNDIDDLYSQIVQKTNTSEKLSKRIKDIETDISNERVGIANSEYESLSSEIEAENNRIRETGEQIKKRREEAKKLKKEFVLLDEELESYKIKDGLFGKVVEKYTTHYYSKISSKPDKTAKLVVLTAKIDCEIDRTSKNWAGRENNLKRNYKDCLVQYYIPLENLKPSDIKYDFKENCLRIYSPKPSLDKEMVYAQTNADKIDEEYNRSWVSLGGTYKALNTEVWDELKQTIIHSADKEDSLKGEAEESARFHLENFFRGFMKGIKGSSDVKIKIYFY